jgi:hypothetical protein
MCYAGHGSGWKGWKAGRAGRAREARSHAALPVDGDVSESCALCGGGGLACFAGRLSSVDHVKEEAPQPGVCVTFTYAAQPSLINHRNAPDTPSLPFL